MSACNFVRSAVNKSGDDGRDDGDNNSNEDLSLLEDATTRTSLQEDVSIIDTSLHFINDLLRNMLDMHKLNANQLSADMSPTDLSHDLFLPIDALLYRRGASFTVQVDCPPNLTVVTDRMRLKQIVLNVSRQPTHNGRCPYLYLFFAASTHVIVIAPFL